MGVHGSGAQNFEYDEMLTFLLLPKHHAIRYVLDLIPRVHGSHRRCHWPPGISRSPPLPSSPLPRPHTTAGEGGNMAPRCHDDIHLTSGLSLLD